MFKKIFRWFFPEKPKIKERLENLKKEILAERQRELMQRIANETFLKCVQEMRDEDLRWN